MSFLDSRISGLLLHPTSLPSGRLGRDASEFVHFLSAAKQRLWQMLPVGPTEDGSPYAALSAFAGNPRLIDPSREPSLSRETGESATSLSSFRRVEAHWLPDYALFTALRGELGGPWTAWPAELAQREPRALAAARSRLASAVAAVEAEQLQFERQWRALRSEATAAGVALVGDIPIYGSHDSADVWANQELFELDDSGQPREVAGVPPDYFSDTGQLWGNPLYDWSRLASDGYSWWVQRFARAFSQFDVVRVDHFRGFESYWAVPAAEETAVNGRWRPGPRDALFEAVRAELGDVSIIAEDLGLITDEVRALRDRLGLPGMRILHFAFDGDPNNPHLPANTPIAAAMYPGTHDNNTSAGWYAEADAGCRARVDELTGGEAAEPAWGLIELAWRSPANVAVAQVQDVLGLGSEARMNVPGVAHGNWDWRMEPGALTPAHAERLAALTVATGR